MPASSLSWLFWISFAVIFYAYLGYGLLLGAMVGIRDFFRRSPKRESGPFYSPVALIICAYNEADWIRPKIANTLALDFPRALLEILIVTDGSDDATPQLVRDYPWPPDVRWKLLHQPERQGKIAAFQRAMQQVETPVVVSTDANTALPPDALQQLLSPFSDPNVGAVAGEKRILAAGPAAASSAGEGLYWRYESQLKKWDAALWTVVGAAGELFAFRTEAYEQVPPDTIIEDFYLTLRIAQHGWRVAYAPQACAQETASASVEEEWKRKVRIAAGGWQAMVRLAALLHPLRYGLLSFQYVSHRVLRWSLAPLLLPVLLLSNMMLAPVAGEFFKWTLAAQGIFYAAALAGWMLERRRVKVKALFVPYYFCMMNAAVYAGFWRWVRGKQTVLWEKAGR